MRELLRALMLFYKRCVYNTAKLITKTDNRTIVFESFQGRSYACNPKGIYEAMVSDEKYSDYRFVWVLRNPENKNRILMNDKCSVVKFESFGYFKELAGAKCWVFNSNTRSFLKPKKNQEFIQTWHGTPLKKIGCDVVKDGNAVTKVSDIPKIYNQEAKKISCMISPSEYCSEKLISAFNLKKYHKEDIVALTGYPRNDSLFDYDKKQIAQIKEELGLPKNKKVILYAPTFRDHKHEKQTGFRFETGIDFSDLKEQLGDSYVILLRAHYFIAEKINLEEYRGFVYNVSDFEDVNRLYLISDLLITDYSSVLFDYANLKRPMFFFVYDYREYKDDVRDLYFDVSYLPGPVVKTQDELVYEIKNYKPDAWAKQYDEFHEKFNYLDGKDCGKKVAEMIRCICKGE